MIVLTFLFISATLAYEEYDITPEEINPLCKMVNEFITTKQPPTPVPIDPPVTGDKCHYFKWVSCEKPSTDPNRPCGWYEMMKCTGAKKKRALVHDNGEEIEDLEPRKTRGVREGPPRPGPVFLGFRNEPVPEDYERFYA